MRRIKEELALALLTHWIRIELRHTPLPPETVRELTTGILARITEVLACLRLYDG